MPAEAEAAARDSVAVTCGECTVVKNKTCQMINIITEQVSATVCNRLIILLKEIKIIQICKSWEE